MMVVCLPNLLCTKVDAGYILSAMDPREGFFAFSTGLAKIPLSLNTIIIPSFVLGCKLKASNPPFSRNC
jgi:hypothetical protein